MKGRQRRRMHLRREPPHHRRGAEGPQLRLLQGGYPRSGEDGGHLREGKARYRRQLRRENKWVDFIDSPILVRS